MSDAEEKPSFRAGCFMFMFGGGMMIVAGSMEEMGMGDFFTTILNIFGIVVILAGCWQVWLRIAGFFGK